MCVNLLFSVCVCTCPCVCSNLPFRTYSTSAHSASSILFVAKSRFVCSATYPPRLLLKHSKTKSCARLACGSGPVCCWRLEVARHPSCSYSLYIVILTVHTGITTTTTRDIVSASLGRGILLLFFLRFSLIVLRVSHKRMLYVYVKPHEANSGFVICDIELYKYSLIWCDLISVNLLVKIHYGLCKPLTVFHCKVHARALRTAIKKIHDKLNVKKKNSNTVWHLMASQCNH